MMTGIHIKSKKRAGLLFPGGIGYITLEYETTADLVKDGNDTIPTQSLN